MISNEEIDQIEMRALKAQASPWRAFIEGRDHESGSNIIKTAESDKRGEDIEIVGASEADFDFIAHAREDIPRLITEIRLLKKQLKDK